MSYSKATSGVVLNLANASANAGEAAGDVVSNAEAFYLSNFNDTFIGQTGQNIVFGLGGNDTMTGGAGANDWLFGGDGNDTLIGGALDDLLSGEGGVEIYHYNTWVGEGFDSIFTFQSDVDKLRFSAGNFGFTAGAVLNVANFKSGAAPVATASAPTFLYNTANGILSFDLDGTGVAFSAVHLAQFAGAPTLVAQDFLFS